MKEKSSCIERELKILGPIDEDKVVSVLRGVAEEEWTLVKTQPELIFDVYLDTSDLKLFSAGVQFRLRRRKVKEGWNSSFKGLSTSNTKFAEREKIQTRLSNDEVLLAQSGCLPGHAARAAYQFLQDLGVPSGSNLYPIVNLISARNRFKLMHEGFTWGDDTAGRQVVFLGFEYVQGYDVRNVDMGHFVQYAWFDYSNTANNIKFFNTELEARGDEIGMEETSVGVINTMDEKLQAEGIFSTKVGKYQYAVEQLVM